MTKSKNTKRALLASVLSMMLCIAMLVGSTFAWFTDSVTSGKNKIVAGNLDVELNWSTDGSTWERVNEDTDIFKDTLWEPGYTRVVYLQVENVGSLALKYQFGINVADKVIGTTADDKDIDLSNFIKFGVVDNATAYTADDAGRTAARNAVKDTAVLVSSGYASPEGNLSAKTTSNTIALVVYMPEEVGNDANYGTGKTQPSVDLGITLVATQYTEEPDSFGNQYDKDAKYPENSSGNEDWYVEGANELTISTAAHLVDLAKRVNEGESFAGKTITLANDIALDGVSNWVPIGTEDNVFDGTFDGKGKTISNLFIDQTTKSEYNYAGLFGVIGGATIKNLTVEGSIIATAKADNAYACGGVCGYALGNSTIDNCTNKVTIDGTNIANDANALLVIGGILGTSAGNAGVPVTISNCTNEGAITCGNASSIGMCVAGGIVSTSDCAKMENCKGNVTVISNNKDCAFVDDVAVTL